MTAVDASWFVRDRLGMFIHWGLYSLGARHEWLQDRERISSECYAERYFTRFDPDLFDPDAWAETAAAAGMKYVVITAKHHDGFCLWDSQLTDYTAVNTPAGKDLLRPMIDAFRKRGIRIGLYYSLLDWHHPHYVIDDVHGPHHTDTAAEREKRNEGRRQEIYTAYLHGQVKELLSDFGAIDILWFDFSYPPPAGCDPKDFARGKGREAWGSDELMRLVRSLQPQCMVTDRLDLLDQPVDFKTPEQSQPRRWVEHNGRRVVWEACQTLSGSWGYHRDECTFRDSGQLIRTLVDCVSKGGNLLLNVGPTSRGEIDDRAQSRLGDIAAWMRRHSRSIYGCTQANEALQAPADTRFTYNPSLNRLYVHLFAYPYKYIHLEGLAGMVDYAQLLHDGSELLIGIDAWHAAHLGTDATTLDIGLPQHKPDVAVPVIELFLSKAFAAKYGR